jgi:tetratricopeptide (TPR) repeat protein
MNQCFNQLVFQSADGSSAEQSIEKLDRQMAAAPSNSSIRAGLMLNKAVLFGVLRQFDEARRQLASALEQSPHDPYIRLGYDFIGGSLLDQEGNPEQAFLKLSDALRKNSEILAEPNARFIYENIQLRRALDAASMGNFEVAFPILNECLAFSLEPEDRSNVLSDLGRCYSELKEYESARASFLQACKIGLTKQSERDVHLYLAIASAHLKLFDEAKREFQVCEERAVMYGLDIEKIYEWLSWVCKGLGEKSESEKYARMAHPI